jgi:hypothetical protein
LNLIRAAVQVTVKNMLVMEIHAQQTHESNTWRNPLSKWRINLVKKSPSVLSHLYLAYNPTYYPVPSLEPVAVQGTGLDGMA